MPRAPRPLPPASPPSGWPLASRVALGCLTALSLAACQGEASTKQSVDPVDAAAPGPGPVAPALDGGSTDAATPDPPIDAGRADAADSGVEEPQVRDFDPNTLDQERLFTCEAPTPASSPARVRRLTPGQYYTRFIPPKGGIPFASDPRFRYSTNTDDARMDIASADQQLTYGLMLGENSATRRAGWGHCMQTANYEPGRDRPTRACMEEFGTRYLRIAWQRDPSAEELERWIDYAWASIDTFGEEKGMALAAARPFVAPEFLFKEELGEGPADADGRVRMESWEIARAVAAAVTDVSLIGHYFLVESHLFDAIDALRLAAESGELETREQVEAHVRALLSVAVSTEDDPPAPVLPTNIRRFFREYFGHPDALYVFKSGGERPQEPIYVYYWPEAFPRSMDRTIAWLYREDQDFLRRLLTTDEFFVDYERRENGWVYNLTDGSEATPEQWTVGWATLPAGERAGVLTHPAWLIAHSRNQSIEPHPVHRGRWIFENLLCNAMPQLPITVDAKLPEMPAAGVRERLETATGPDAEGGYCWTCHKLMDPLGIPFETYSHYGRHRTEEQTADGSMVPVDAASTLVWTGDPALDGQAVADAVELSELLASSERVEGCFTRNVFRYFMGRNETYEDACTLHQMREAYRASEGSFQEMLVALLTSDTFLYRRAAADEAQP